MKYKLGQNEKETLISIWLFLIISQSLYQYIIFFLYLNLHDNLYSPLPFLYKKYLPRIYKRETSSGGLSVYFGKCLSSHFRELCFFTYDDNLNYILGDYKGKNKLLCSALKFFSSQFQIQQRSCKVKQLNSFPNILFLLKFLVLFPEAV